MLSKDYRFFLECGVKIKEQGVYQGVKKDFETFAIAQGSLPETKCFLKVVDQWYISYFGDTPDSPEYRSDALDSYYRITKQTDEYIRKQKHRIWINKVNNRSYRQKT